MTHSYNPHRTSRNIPIHEEFKHDLSRLDQFSAQGRLRRNEEQEQLVDTEGQDDYTRRVKRIAQKYEDNDGFSED